MLSEKTKEKLVPFAILLTTILAVAGIIYLIFN